MDTNFADEMDEWSFPSFSEEEPEAPVYVSPTMESTIVHVDPPAAVQAVEDLNKNLNDLEHQKQEFEKRIVLLDAILKKLSKPIPTINKEVMGLIYDIIKKLTKKIVLHEIHQDPDLMPKLINELNTSIKNQDEVVTIYLCEKDHMRLACSRAALPGNLQINSTLQEGDIVISSSVAEVRAQLNTRLNELLRLSNG